MVWCEDQCGGHAWCDSAFSFTGHADFQLWVYGYDDRHGVGGGATRAGAKLPRSGSKQPEQIDGNKHIPSQLRMAVWIGLFAVTAFIFSATMIWAFVERMASIAGFEPVLVGKILSLTLVFAVLGSLAAAVMGNRFGSGKPFAAATIIFLLAIAWLSSTTTLVNYAIGACLLTLAVGLGITYVITIVADLDSDGRYVVLTVPAIGIGVMVAPTVGGMLTASRDFSAIFVIGGITVILSLLAGLLALHKGLPVRV